MKFHGFPVESVAALAQSNDRDRELAKYLIDIWANVNDTRINNDLLKTLVLRYAEVEKRMRTLNEELKHSQMAFHEDLGAAASIQKTLLPTILPESDRIEVAFEFLPCEQVGGDIVNLLRYDEDNWLVYVLDVAGHGPRAAMVSVAVAQFLQVSSRLKFLKPSSVMAALDKEFPFTRFNSFFTIIYGVFNLRKMTFNYCNSGHPNPVLMQPGLQPIFLEGNGPILGLGLPTAWPEVMVDLTQEKSVLLYTDGLIECANVTGRFFGEERLIEMLNRLQSLSAPCIASLIMNEMREFMGLIKFQDDFTLLVMKSKV